MRDEAAFVEFAHGVRERLRRTAYLLCGDWDQASDFVQEGLIRVYTRWSHLERSGGEHAYARRAVVSAFLDHTRRRSSTEIAMGPDSGLTSHLVSGHDVATQVVTREALMQGLATLAPRQRACVVLRYFEDLSVAETAVLLRCSEGTVKSQTSRALFSLRNMFEDSPQGELTQGAISW